MEKVEHLFAWWRYSEIDVGQFHQTNVLGISHVGVQPQHRGRQLPERGAICADALLLAYYSVWYDMYDITGCMTCINRTRLVAVLQQYTPIDMYATLSANYTLQAGQGGKTRTKNNERSLTTVVVGVYYQYIKMHPLDITTLWYIIEFGYCRHTN